MTCIEKYGRENFGVQQGEITYNPCLALRQFGYARRDGPHEMLIQGFVFDYDNDDQGLRHRFIRAWRMLNVMRWEN